MKFITVFFLFFLASCLQNKMDKITGTNNDMTVKCYSKGKEIYSGISRSRIEQEKRMAYFTDDKGSVKVIGGDCVFTSLNKKVEALE